MPCSLMCPNVVPSIYHLHMEMIYIVKKVMLPCPRLVCVILQVSQVSFVLVCLLNQAVKATPMSSFTADKPSLDQNVIGAVSSGQ